ncbi:DUF2147 domain-containing protein [Microvirga antarctica]|uniref:DUF2147 domain-containing protein n=1 Tax=Microvirga antarctica TaxID=2819233 RepID=UPI001B30E612|nr:DUF2147 domain-containing protein [Microvirga antarctica]
MKWISLAAFAAALSVSSVSAQTADPSGVYVNETGETRVRVARCGPVHCGTIIGVNGQTIDENNPDPSLRARSLIGVLMIADIKPAEGGFSGQLYNYKDGRTYAGKAVFEGGAMRLSGCVLGGLICRTQVWARAN